ncbi:sensor histidine kinase [Coralliovum pocilloporae]|uniref:sensor histidine kinase n=1 Tax=Coralliovum pocilloporae TaxID=3066369 RepID=UPI0033077FD7
MIPRRSSPKQVTSRRFSVRRYSLRRRLLVFLLVPLSAIGVLAIYGAYQSAIDTANEVFDRVLSGSALAIAERVFVNDDAALDVDIPYVALEMLTSSAQDRVFYRVETADGALVTGYEGLGEVLSGVTTDDRFSYADSVYRGAPIRLAVYHSASSTGERSISYRVMVAETTNARTALAQQLILRAALRQLMLIGAAAVLVWVAVTRSLRPLKRLEEAIDRRSPDDLRPIEHDVPEEVGGLVDRINDFMARLDQALNALRHFTGNVSHQLRTPMTILRTQIALASRSSDPEQIRAVLKDGDEAISDAERTLNQLLLMARVDEWSSTALLSETVNLNQLVREVGAAHAVACARAGFDLEFQGEQDVMCSGDAVLLQELVGNLIDNAVKHAKGGSRIILAVDRTDDEARIRVEDNGAGIPEDRREAVLSRFQTTGRNGSGQHGLGLPIAVEITRLFGGKLCLFETTPDGGLSVHIQLPAQTC